MKTFLTAMVAIVAAALFALPAPAFAEGDIAQGRQVFANNCAACHMGGGNVVMGMKTLKQDALEQYLDNFDAEHNVEAIDYQVANGKNAMPAFSGRLTPEQIENVAAYVKSQAENGWVGG